MAETKLDLEAIRKRCEAASPGPWRTSLNEERVRSANVSAMEEGDFPGFAETPEFRVEVELFHDDGGTKRNILPVTHLGIAYQANAEFIANARQDIPALLAEIERLRDYESPTP